MSDRSSQSFGRRSEVDIGDVGSGRLSPRYIRRATVAFSAAMLLTVGGITTIPALADETDANTPLQAELDPLQSEDRFLELYNKIKDPANGYFHSSGVPYHSVEELIVEAPDQGHQTTSEAFSYLMWLEASYGRVTGDWGPFNDAWSLTEQYAIPDDSQSNYDPSAPATYAPESDSPTDYPAQLDFDAPVGQDPLASELSGSPYQMHWLLDVDNAYGYGECGDGTTEPAYINTFQRGSQESTWETVTHPSCDDFTYGGENGYVDLFTGDEQYSEQWRYTSAPDADARAVQVAYWALQWAREQGNEGQISGAVANAAQMGDWLRYAQYDKYFKEIGDCVDVYDCANGSGKSSAHFLLSWYFAWGGGIGADWGWRIGGSGIHQGYQNPMAAWAMVNEPSLNPPGATAVSDWQTSLDTQIDFYQWLQSAEGAIAGGATNNWGGNYGEPTTSSTFNGMAYDPMPVWHDPPSNRWFGFQAWSLERVAEYYYATDDAEAGALLDDWVDWAISETTIGDGTYQFPSDMTWTGEPDTWSGSPSANSNLHVSVDNYTSDVGVAGSYAKLLLYYAAASGDQEALTTAEGLLEGLYANSDDMGIAIEETRADYCRFADPLYIPEGWTGTMPNGDEINSDSTFISMRTFMTEYDGWDQVQSYIDGGCNESEAPTFTYHRFWAQVDIATAFSTHAELFGEDDNGGPTTTDPGTSEPPTGDCTVDYSVNDWGSGFTANVVVTAGDSGLNGWTVSWTWPGNQQVTQGWNAQIQQSGSSVTASNLSYNGTVASGQTTNFGFNGSYSGGNSPPTNFTCSSG